jgi:hypothetical protein
MPISPTLLNLKDINMSDTRLYSTISVNRNTHIKAKQFLLDKQKETGETWTMTQLFDYLLEKETNKED